MRFRPWTVIKQFYFITACTRASLFSTSRFLLNRMYHNEVLRVKKLSENAIIPARGSEFAAGYDLSSAVDTVVPARGKALVKTDLAIAIPENTYARIAPR